VLNRAVLDLVGSGLIRPEPQVTLCLAMGKVYSDPDRASIHRHFEQMSWKLFDDLWITESLRSLAEAGYEDDACTYVAKLLLRKARSHKASG